MQVASSRVPLGPEGTPPRGRRPELAVVAWSAVAAAGLALPAVLGFGLAAAVIVRTVVTGQPPSVLVIVGGVFGGLAAVAKARDALGAARAGMTASQVDSERLAAHAGGLRAVDFTHILHETATRPYDVLDASAVLPELVTLANEVADSVGVARPPAVRVDQMFCELAGGPDGLTVGVPFLGVCGVDELRAEIARVLATTAAAPIAALDRARLLGAVAAVVEDPDTPVLRRFFWLVGVAGRRAARTARFAAAKADAVGRAAAAAATSHETVELARVRRSAISALWRPHLAALQRAWTETSQSVAPLEGWPDAYARHVGSTVSRVDLPFSTWLERGEWLGAGDPYEHVSVPALPSPTGLSALAGEALPEVLRYLDDQSAGGYASPQVPDVLREQAPDEPPVVPGLAELQAEAAESLTPVSTLLLGQITALRIAMGRRDEASLSLARKLDTPASWPGVRVTAAAVRWLCDDEAGLSSLQQALVEHPGAAPAVATIEPILRSAGHLGTADAIAARIAMVERVLSRGVNLKTMWGRGQAIEPAPAGAELARLIGEYLEDAGHWRRAWLVLIDSGEQSAPRRWGIVFQRRWSVYGSDRCTRPCFK